MGSKRDRLRAEGKATAAGRGHRMGRFRHDDRGAVAECVECGFTVAVIDAPRANEADLMGTALAVDCEPDGCRWRCDTCGNRLWRAYERNGHRALTGHEDFSRIGRA